MKNASGADLRYCLLTTADLRDLGACHEQLDLFALLHPHGVTCPDAAAVLAAMNAGLNVEWLAVMLAPAPLWAEYERRMLAWLAEYTRQRAPLLAEYKRRCAPLLADLLAVVWPVED